MNISLFNDWLEQGLFGDEHLSSLLADIVDEAMRRDPGESAPSERVDEQLMAEAWSAAQNDSEVVRYRTAVVLGRLGYAPVHPVLESAVRSPDPDVASAAAIALASSGRTDDELIELLVRTLNNSDEARELRSAAAQTLASAGTSAAVAALLKAAESEDPELAQYGIEGLGNTKVADRTEEHRAVLDALLAALRGKVPLLQSAAAEALGTFGDASVVKELERLLIEKDATLRRRTLLSLARLGSETARTPLARMLRDFSVPARWEIADLVGECYGESMVEAISAALKNADAELQDHAVAALGRMKGAESLQLLRQLAEAHADPYVREQALSALERRGERLKPVVVPEQKPQPSSAKAPPPPPQSDAPKMPATAKGLARLQPVFRTGSARPAAPHDVVEQALRSMECPWRLEPQGYVAEVPSPNGKETVRVLLGESDGDGAAIYRFVIACGAAESADMEAALRNNRALDYGALAIENVAGVPTLVLTETLLADEATPDAVTRIIAALMRSARDLAQ